MPYPLGIKFVNDEGLDFRIRYRKGLLQPAVVTAQFGKNQHYESLNSKVQMGLLELR